MGVPLFDENPNVRERYNGQKLSDLALLAAGERPRRQVNDDSWDEVCDEAELTHSQRVAFMHRQFLHPGVFD